MKSANQLLDGEVRWESEPVHPVKDREDVVVRVVTTAKWHHVLLGLGDRTIEVWKELHMCDAVDQRNVKVAMHVAVAAIRAVLSDRENPVLTQPEG